MKVIRLILYISSISIFVLNESYYYLSLDPIQISQHDANRSQQQQIENQTALLNQLTRQCQDKSVELEKIQDRIKASINEEDLSLQQRLSEQARLTTIRNEYGPYSELLDRYNNLMR